MLKYKIPQIVTLILENGVFIVVRLHLSCCFSTKKNKESAVFVWEKRVRLRQKRMEEAGIFYVELLL